MVTLLKFFRSIISFLTTIIQALSDLGLKLPGAEKVSDLSAGLDEAESKIDDLF